MSGGSVGWPAPVSEVVGSAGLKLNRRTTASTVVTSAIAPRLGTELKPCRLVGEPFNVNLTVRDV